MVVKSDDERRLVKQLANANQILIYAKDAGNAKALETASRLIKELATGPEVEQDSGGDE